MNKNFLLIAAVAVGAVMVLNKAAAQVAPAGTRAPAGSAPIQNNNINDQLWKKLMGGAWTGLVDATNPDGTAAFLKRNFLGQTVNSAGVPISEQLIDMLPVTYGNQDIELDLSGGDGVDWLKGMGW
jgi:hypothetical protein